MMDFVRWIESKNEELRKLDVPVERRPYIILRNWSAETGMLFMGRDSKMAEDVFTWYEEKYTDVKSISGEFKSVFYIDSEFWQLSIPIIYGTVKVDPFACLVNMPNSLKDELFANADCAQDYISFWVDCMDYAYGFQHILSSDKINPDGLPFFKAADQNLKLATTHFYNRVNNSVVVWNCRDALERYMKALIGFEIGLSEKEARNIGHDLDEAFKRLLEIPGNEQLEALADELNVYPEYKKNTYDRVELDRLTEWRCFRFSQHMGAHVVLKFTGTNILNNILESA